MNTPLLKILSIILLFVGESIAIYAEVLAARNFTDGSFWPLFLKMFIVMTVAGGALLLGYMLGYKSFRDIWLVSVFSITSIIIMEPIINYIVFHELPARGPAIGFILGILGLAASLIF